MVCRAPGHRNGMSVLRTRQVLPPTWLFVTLGVFVVSGFAFATFQVWSNDLALRDRGRETVARVVEVGTCKTSRVNVTFTTEDGRQVEALVGQGDEAPGDRVKVGEEIPIVYDPEHPTADVRDSRAPENHSTAYLLLGVTAFAAVTLPVAAWHLARERRRRKG